MNVKVQDLGVTKGRIKSSKAGVCYDKDVHLKCSLKVSESHEIHRCRSM